MQNSADIRTLATEAKQLFAEWQKADAAVVSDFDSAIDRAWRFGKVLNQLKRSIDHGNWESWRADTFPKLTKLKACSCMALDNNNPNVQNSKYLSAESVRKFRYGYVPVKERGKLRGDRKFNRPSHHSSTVNECNKLMQRIKTKQYKPDWDELASDFAPFYRWLHSEVFDGEAPQ